MISLETRYRSVVHYKYFLRSLRKVCNIYNVSNETEISMKSKNVIKKKVCGALGTTFW